MDEEDARSEPSELVTSLSGAGGAVVGAAVTQLAGPFAGGASGALMERVFLRVGTEIERRVLSPRQAKRIEDAYRVASDSIADKLERGEEPRADGFFDEDDHGNSAAEELLEGVLRTAADAWEQRKVPYLGRLFSGLSFDSGVDVADGSYFLRLADRLTYRQLALLAFWRAAGEGGPYEEAVIRLGIDQDEQGGHPTAVLIAEMDDLLSAGLLGVIRANGTVGAPDPSIAGIADVGSFRGADLTSMRLTAMGETLHKLMDLDLVPTEDLDSVLEAARGRE